MRIVSETIPCECSIKEEADAGVHEAMQDIVAALTRPLAPEEAAPRRREKEDSSRVAFKGRFDEFNRYFYKRGWGDGLPLVPPTEAAVREMLAATDLAPDHVVGKIEPRHGKATVEKIAVNAVMAGALPIHMPILIACVEAASDPNAGLGSYGTSTGSWSPFWIVNGPVRADARINCSSGAMSPGDIANAAIGRAMGLIIKNIGGARKAVEDMGIYGHPGRYSMVVGENEEANPWDPIHVEHGLSKDDSAVTLFFPNCYWQIWQYGSDDRGILSTLIYNLLPGRSGLTCLMMTPQHARVLARSGWTKAMIRKYVYEYGRVPAYRHLSMHEGGGWTLKGPDAIAPSLMDMYPIVPSPAHLMVLVTGGPGAYMAIAAGSGFGAGLTPAGAGFVTKKIQLPADWGRLVAKYRNYAPTYEKY